MPYEHQRANNSSPRACVNLSLFRLARLLAVVLSLSLFFYGCTGGANINSNTGANVNVQITSNANANAAATPGSMAGEQLTLREPQSYSVEMTISVEASGDNRQVKSVPIQFDFTRNGTDRRWAFKALPSLGDVVYLEKSGMKYAVFPAQKQYVELQGNEMGFQLGTLLTPTMAIEQLRSRGQVENLGIEPVNERPATKYRFAATANTQQAGAAQTESFVYVDQETGLPLRADMYLATSGGQTMRVMTETRNINLTPDLTMLDVPAGMRKVTTQELNQQIQSFVNLLQVAAQLLRNQGGATPPQ